LQKPKIFGNQLTTEPNPADVITAPALFAIASSNRGVPPRYTPVIITTNAVSVQTITVSTKGSYSETRPCLIGYLTFAGECGYRC